MACEVFLRPAGVAAPDTGRSRARHAAAGPGLLAGLRNFDSEGRPGLPRAAALDYG
jgi:hypothetical protein